MSMYVMAGSLLAMLVNGVFCERMSKSPREALTHGSIAVKYFVILVFVPICG